MQQQPQIQDAKAASVFKRARRVTSQALAGVSGEAIEKALKQLEEAQRADQAEAEARAAMVPCNRMMWFRRKAIRLVHL